MPRSPPGITYWAGLQRVIDAQPGCPTPVPLKHSSQFTTVLTPTSSNTSPAKLLSPTAVYPPKPSREDDLEAMAEVVLGVPLAIWALKRCAEILDTVRRGSEEMKTFKANLTIQRKLLELNYECMGLSSLAQGEREAHLRSRFPDIAADLLLILGRMDDLTSTLYKDLDTELLSQDEVSEYFSVAETAADGTGRKKRRE